jgi:FlaA1/EpsC-like NDP-sugar epimerase
MRKDNLLTVAAIWQFPWFAVVSRLGALIPQAGSARAHLPRAGHSQLQTIDTIATGNSSEWIRTSMSLDKHNPWAGKRVLITGVCGTVGRELLRQVSAAHPAQIVGLDNNESELFFVREEYRDRPEVQVYLGDIRDRDRLIQAMAGIDIVLHSAALKHVILCEQSPRDAVQSNILGVQNVIDAATMQQVERVLFTSSDKAVNPTNVMGTSKLMGERLMTAANAHRRGSGPIFASTRFGNVLGSRGSVIPLFRRQIAQGGPVTLTDPAMTRFIMTLESAVRLVMESTFMAHGGEVFVTKMPVARIADLAEVMIEELAPRYGYAPADIATKVIGSKAGEKLYEELMNDEETRRTIELPHYFVVLPAFKSVYEDIHYHYPAMGDIGVDRPYNSAVEPAFDRADLRRYLLDHHLLEEN